VVPVPEVVLPEVVVELVVVSIVLELVSVVTGLVVSVISIFVGPFAKEPFCMLCHQRNPPTMTITITTIQIHAFLITIKVIW
jgi:hypothetical protein